MKNKKKLHPMSIVVFDPEYAKKNPEAYKNGPIKLGEHVIYLGNIPNCPGHCVVANLVGKVIWMVHTDSFREAMKDEL